MSELLRSTKVYYLFVPFSKFCKYSESGFLGSTGGIPVLWRPLLIFLWSFNQSFHQSIDMGCLYRYMGEIKILIIGIGRCLIKTQSNHISFDILKEHPNHLAFHSYYIIELMMEILQCNTAFIYQLFNFYIADIMKVMCSVSVDHSIMLDSLGP